MLPLLKMICRRQRIQTCVNMKQADGEDRLNNWKNAHVISLFKKGKRDNGDNYREQKNSWIKLSSRREMTYTVAVEGNIGSGKTTLLQHFSKFQNTMIIQEPVERWRNMKGFNLLDLMYSDPKRWSLTFQTYVQLTMLHNHQTLHTADVKLMERSIYSARHCFVENLFRSQLMPEVEYLVLCEWYKWLVSKQDLYLDLIVYLRTKPETVHKRIQQRCRKEEKAIPLEYLRNLHDLHEEWLMSKNVTFPVLVLEADSDLNAMEQVFEKHTCDILFQNKMPPKTGKAAI